MYVARNGGKITYLLLDIYTKKITEIKSILFNIIQLIFWLKMFNRILNFKLLSS